MKRSIICSSAIALLTAFAALTMTSCAHDAAGPSVQRISKDEARQIGMQSMNQTESWEPNVVYDTQRDGKFWKVTGYKTRGNEPISGKPIYIPGVYRVVKLSPYGKVIDFWRVDPKTGAYQVTSR